MKKIILILSVNVVFSLGLAGCGKESSSNAIVSSSENPSVQDDGSIKEPYADVDKSSVVVRGGLSVQSAPSEGGSPSSWFKKTNNKCRVCSGCTGYWGIYHQNGTYEGSCKNSDGWGHTCGHGPEKHGLRRW